MDFKENLIQLRKKANLSQEQLADKLNVTRQAISKWESGQTMPEADKILLLSDIFNVTTDRLLKGTEDSQNHKKEGVDFFPLMGYIFLILLAIGGYIGYFVLYMDTYFFLLMMIVPIVIFSAIAIFKIKKAVLNKNKKHQSF